MVQSFPKYLFMAIDQHFDILRHLLPFKHIEVVRGPLQVVSYWESRVAILIDTSLQKVHIFGFTDDDESEGEQYLGETTCGT